MPPMKPSAKERAEAVQSAYYIHNVAFANAVRLSEESYRDGFAAALAMLREPSEELIAAVKKPISNTIGMGEDEDWTARAALAAAADAIGDVGTEKPARSDPAG